MSFLIIFLSLTSLISAQDLEHELFALTDLTDAVAERPGTGNEIAETLNIPSSKISAEASLVSQTFTWTGDAGDNNWHTAGNWDPVGIPGQDDNVTIGTGSPAINDLPVIIASLTQRRSDLTLNNDLTITGSLILHDFGAIEGDSDLTIAGIFTWGRGASIRGSGVVDVNGGINWDSGSTYQSRHLAGRTLNLNTSGTFTRTGSTTLHLFLEGGAIFNIPEGVELNLVNNPTNSSGNLIIRRGTVVADEKEPVINIYGRLSSNAPTTSTSIQGVLLLFRPGSELDVQTGTLDVNWSSHISGLLRIAAGAELRLGGSEHVFDGEYQGDGLLRVNTKLALGEGTHLESGHISIFGVHGILTLNANTRLNHVTLHNSGAIVGDADLTIGGIFTWGRGGSLRGSGVVDVNGGINWDTGSYNQARYLAGRTLNLNTSGTLTTTGTTTLNLYLEGGAVFNIPEGVELNLFSNATGSNRLGIIRGTIGTDEEEPIINIYGHLNSNTSTTSTVISGVINIYGRLSSNSSTTTSTRISGEPLALHPGSELHVQTGTLDVNWYSHISGLLSIAAGAELSLGGNEHVFDGEFQGDGVLRVARSQLELGQDLQIGSGHIYVRNITGRLITTGNTVLNRLTSFSGNITGDGELTVTDLFTWTGGTVTGITILRPDGGLRLSAPNGVVALGEETALINRGRLWSGVSGTVFTLDGDFINEGTIDLGESDLVLRPNRGILNQGLLKGSGTIMGNVDNISGTISPGIKGTSHGQIYVDGTYTQGSMAKLKIGIGGRTAGSGYDQFRANTMNLDGILNLELTGGFIPNQNDLFQVAMWPNGTRIGSFSALEQINDDEVTLALRYTSHAVEVYDGSDISFTPSPSISVSVSSMPFQRLGRSVQFSASINNPGMPILIPVETENLGGTGPPAVPECPTDDAYENLKCRLAPFGIVPPEPEDGGDEYPMLTTKLFPAFPKANTDPNGVNISEFTAVLGSEGSLKLASEQVCNIDEVHASATVGRAVTDVTLAGCAYAMAKLALPLVPGFECFKLATGIGTAIGEGIYSGQFDLAAYMTANIMGAFSCANDFIPPARLIAMIHEINKILLTVGSINETVDACISTTGSGSVSGSGSSSTSCIFSWDPNDKHGPEGVLAERFIASGDSMGFTVFFENKEEATAPAQVVIISDTLDVQHLDLSTFSFGMVAWTDTSAVLAPDTLISSVDVDLRPAMNLVVRVDAELDETTGIIRWVFDSLDPETLEPTPDPLAGFLPPNDENFAGEGLVSYSVSLKPDVPSGTRFGSAARIFFDENEPIDTPVWSNILDTEAPVSVVNPLDSVQTSAEFTVSWTGQDDASGIRTFTIYVSENGAGPDIWLSDTEATSMTFAGINGSTYEFFSSATDHVGNRSERGMEPEAVTTVQLPTSIERPELPAEFSLSQNYPNPFNPSTLIRFGLPESAEVRLEVYDISGRLVAVLSDGRRAAGWHTVRFDGSALSSGVYVYRLRAGDFVQSRKLMFVK